MDVQTTPTFNSSPPSIAVDNMPAVNSPSARDVTGALPSGNSAVKDSAMSEAGPSTAPEESKQPHTIPTVTFEDSNTSGDERTSQHWNAPTCASDFSLEWVQYVMEQYYNCNFDMSAKKENLNNKKDSVPTVRRFSVNMAGSPDEEKSCNG